MITRAGQSCKGALPLVSTGEANGNGIVAVVNSRAKQFTGETQGPRQEMTGADSWATKSGLVLHRARHVRRNVGFFDRPLIHGSVVSLQYSLLSVADYC